MANLQQIMQRAQALRRETALDSISPERAGSIMYDTLSYINQMQLQDANPILLSKIYSSVEAMQADTAPVSDITGKALRPGQVVVIVTSSTSSQDYGVVYRYNGTVDGASSWTAVGKIGSSPYLEGYLYAGIATPATDPQTENITQRVFYRAVEPGTYTNFGGIVVNSGEVVNLKFDGSSWSKEVTGEASAASVTELGQELLVLQSISVSSAASGITAKGQYYFNSTLQRIYECIEYTGDLSTSTFTEVPFRDGAIYTLNSKLYIWNGSELIEFMKGELREIYTRELVTHSHPGPLMEDGFTIVNAGDISLSYWHTDFIIAKMDGVYNLHALGLAGNAYAWYYDKAFNLIGKEVAAQSGPVDFLSRAQAPEGTVYIRFNFGINNATAYVWPRCGYVASPLDYDDMTNSLEVGLIAKNKGNVGDLLTVTKQANASYVSLVTGVRRGESFRISGLGGDGARLFTITDADGRIVATANANQTVDGMVLDIMQDGALSVNFNAGESYKLLKFKNTIFAISASLAKTDISDVLEPFGVQNAGTVGSAITLSITNRQFLHAIINVKAGEDYVVTATAASALRAFALQDNDGVILDVATANIAEKDRHIHVCKDGTLSVNVNPQFAYALYKLVPSDSPESVIVPVLGKEMSNYEQSHILQNRYQQTFERAYAGGITNYFEIPNVGNEDIVIDVATTTNGFPLVIKLEYMNGEQRQIYYPRTFSGHVAVPITLTSALKQFYINCGSAATQGVMTINVYISPSRVPTISDISFKRKFQFGRICTYQYESPELIAIPEHVFTRQEVLQPHPVGSVIGVFYRLYDELVSAYPDYVEKVDCDALALAAGIDKSDYAYMDGLSTYMYKFIPPKTRTPDASQTFIEIGVPKLFIVSGTHPEYEGMYDVLHMMQRVCRNWKEDRNLEELRWNAEIYVMPCSAAWSDDNGIRCPLEYDGDTPVRALRADPNRNALAKDWQYTDPTNAQVLSGHTWSGAEAGDLYETKVFTLVYDAIMPDVFIDRHNAYLPTHDENRMIYSVSKQAMVRDCCNDLVSMMTRSWKERFCASRMPADPTWEEEHQIYIFPSNEQDYTTLLGSIYGSTEKGMRQSYAAERGALALTAESRNGTVYYDGQLGDSTHNYDQLNTRLVYTTGMEALVNLCCRLLALVSFCDSQPLIR